MRTLAMINDDTQAQRASGRTCLAARSLEDDLLHLEGQIDARLRRWRLRRDLTRTALTVVGILVPLAGMVLSAS